MTIVIGTLTVLLAGLAASRLRRSKARPGARPPGENHRDGVSSKWP